MVCAAKSQPSRTTFCASDFPMEAPATSLKTSGLYEWASLFFAVDFAQNEEPRGPMAWALSRGGLAILCSAETQPVDKPVERL